MLREAGHRTATLSTESGSRADRFYREAGWTALHIDKRGEQVFRLERNAMRWNRMRFHLIAFARTGVACCRRHDGSS